MVMKPEVQRRKQRAREREHCPVHGYMRHGKEAEELRKGIEKLIKEYGPIGDYFDGEDTGNLLGDLQGLLDSTDARDSLAYLERLDAQNRSRKGRGEAQK